MSDVAFKVAPGKAGNPPMGFAALDTASSDVTIEWTSATSFRIVVTNLPPSGVASLTAGTAIALTGTASDPIVNLSISADPDNMAGVDGSGDLLVLLGRLGLLSFKDPNTGAPVPDAYIQGYLAKGVTPALELGVGVVTFSLAAGGITAGGNVSVNGTVSASHFSISSAIYSGAINTAVTGNLNNWLPTNWNNRSMFRVTPSAAWTLTGAFAVDSSRRTIFNVSSTNTLTLAHESASSTAANRFICPNNTNYVIQPNAAVDIWYDSVSQRWRVIR
jgi:hypothetical protein